MIRNSLIYSNSRFREVILSYNPNLTDSANQYSIFLHKTRCIDTLHFSKMKNVKNHKMRDKTLNSMKKTEA